MSVFGVTACFAAPQQLKHAHPLSPHPLVSAAAVEEYLRDSRALLLRAALIQHDLIQARCAVLRMLCVLLCCCCCCALH